MSKSQISTDAPLPRRQSVSVGVLCEARPANLPPERIAETLCRARADIAAALCRYAGRKRQTPATAQDTRGRMPAGLQHY
ncbi:MAG: hypothetical protein ACT4O9_01940 [Blastocatellia bacterium]